MKQKKNGMEFMFDLFYATRNHKKFLEIIVPPELEPYISTLYEKYNQPSDYIKVKGELIPINKEKSDFAGFSYSGGKDSLAIVLKNKDRFEKSICFYISGITSYVEEKEYFHANAIAKELSLELKNIAFELKNHTSLPESVIKNQMIYALILHQTDKLPVAIGFGGTRELGPQSMAFYHDSADAFYKFHEFAVAAWGNHKLIPFLKDEIEAYEIIYKKAPGIIDFLSSCITPNVMKEAKRISIQKRFRIELLNPYQCGGCYKCAEKFVIDARFYRSTISEDYLNYCKALLIEKCVFEHHNMNGLIPWKYLEKLGINSVVELFNIDLPP